MSRNRRVAPKWLRPYLPNRSDGLGLVSLSDPKPFSAYWPLILTQIVGGKTWSISFIRHTTPKPVLTEVLLMSRAWDMPDDVPTTQPDADRPDRNEDQ